MFITDIFIKRPVLAVCFNLLILFTGLIALDTITTRQYPRSDLATITVRTIYVGADANLIRGFLTTPLERSIASADGIDYLESSSAEGVSTITAHLLLNYNVNEALTQVQAKVAEVRSELPPEAESPIISVESSDSRFASMYLSFYSKSLHSNEITDYLTRVVQPALTAIPGVQKADILGARTPAMRIWLKSAELAARGLSPSLVREKLAENNVRAALGRSKGSLVSVPLKTNTDLESVEDFEQLVLLEQDGTQILLRDVADIELGAENYDEDVRFDGQAATFVGIWVLPNANTLDVVANVRKTLPAIEERLPKGLSLGVPYDSTKYIRSAITEVVKTLAETIFIVVLVIFIFIGSLRSVLVPVVAIPLSLIGAFGLMYLFGFTMNLLTLLAIVLAVGLVVDDAIVMLENVERYIRDGIPPLKAALTAARELVGPTVAMTITLAAVYAPIGFQGGLTGALFREFALTLAGAVIVSGVVALTLSPVMAATLVRRIDKPSKFVEYTQLQFHRLETWYHSALQSVLKFRVGILAGALCIMLWSVPFYLFSMKELAPREDQGVVFGIVQTSPNNTIEQTTLFTKQLQSYYKDVPEYATSFQRTGATGGFSGMVVKPFEERSRTTQEMANELWGKAAQVPGIRTIVTTPPPLPGGSQFPVEFVISSVDEPLKLVGFALDLVGTAFQSGKFMFADTDLKIDLPETTLVIDRRRVADLGLDLRDVAKNIEALTGGNYVNRFSMLGRSYKVIAQAKRSERLNPEQLLNIQIPSRSGEMVPLSSFTTLETKAVPRELKRFQQLNSVTVQGATIPGTSLDQALTVLEDRAAEILPGGYKIDYAGESRQLRTEGNQLIKTLFIAFVLIYLVLAAQFESFRDPFIILMGSVPLALSGALLFPFLGFTTMNIYSQVGLVTLVGLVAKNGILIVEFANVERERGRDRFTAVVEAARIRLRPILMTSTATVLGHFPLIIAAGAGAEARNSIGITLVAGMLIGTVFTLFVVPCIYVFIAKGDEMKASPEESANEAGVNVEGDESVLVSGVHFALTPLNVFRRWTRLRVLNFGHPFRACILLLFLLISGCSIGPDFRDPYPTLDGSFHGATNKAEEDVSLQFDSPFWISIQDDTLDELLRRTLLNNRSLKESYSRLTEARALLQERRSEFFPGAELQGSYERAQNPGIRFPGGGSSAGFKYDLYSSGVAASWEIDLFGQIRRSFESGKATSEQQKALFEDTLRTLTVDVADSYFQFLGARERLRIHRESLEVQKKLVSLTEERFEIGVVGALDPARATARLKQTASALPPLKREVQLQLHRLATLTGSSIPETKELLKKSKTALPEIQKPLYIRGTEEVLRRRPDLRAAEHELHARTADIGVALGELYPKISLTGRIGYEATHFSDLGKGLGEFYSWGPGISWRPFDNGTLRARARAADARSLQALYRFEGKVLSVIEEIENSLVNYQTAFLHLNALRAAERSTEEAFRIANAQYREGLIDYLSLAETEQNLLDVTVQVADARTEYVHSFLGVHRSLGSDSSVWNEEKFVLESFEGSLGRE